MDPQTDRVFSALTSKQAEALDLACQHHTSKQIALKLDITPASVDKRIDSVRSKLNGMPRVDLLNQYANWLAESGKIPPVDARDRGEQTSGKTRCPPYEEGSRTTSGSIPLTHSSMGEPKPSPQSEEPTYTFADSYVLPEHTSTQGWSFGPFPGIKPSDLGVVGKLVCILGGAVALIGIAILSVAFSQALTTMFGG